MRIVPDTGYLKQAVGRCNRLYSHLVTCQGAGFVRTDNSHRTQCLDRWQSPDDGMTMRHALHTDGQRNGHNGRQAFRNRGHRQTHRCKEHLRSQVIPDHYAKHECQRSDSDDHSGEPAGKL